CSSATAGRYSQHIQDPERRHRMARSLPRLASQQRPAARLRHAWLFGALALVGVGVPALRNDSAAALSPKAAAEMTGAAKVGQPANELMQVAQWLEPVVSGKHPEKVSDAIRKNPESFQAF